MLLYCLKCRKNTKNKKPYVAKTKNGSYPFIKMCNVKRQKLKIYQRAKSWWMLKYLRNKDTFNKSSFILEVLTS